MRENGCVSLLSLFEPHCFWQDQESSLHLPVHGSLFASEFCIYYRSIGSSVACAYVLHHVCFELLLMPFSRALLSSVIVGIID